MAYDSNEKRIESVYSKRIKAGKRRTYFFDVRATKANDYYLTITESRKRFDSDSYERHKVFVYKEDFNKFVNGLIEAVDYVKTELMPDFNFDAFNHENDGEYVPQNNTMPDANVEEVTAVVIEEAKVDEPKVEESPSIEGLSNQATEEVDKW